MTRLIEEEEAFKVLSAYYRHKTPTQDSALHDALSRVPTVDAVPTKHGRWVEWPECLQYDNAVYREDIVCSICGAVFNTVDNCTEEFDYCPHCGADMRGEK